MGTGGKPTGKKKTTKKGRRGKRDIRLIPEAAQKYGIRSPNDLPPGDRYISPNQAGKILNVTGEAVKQWIYNHRLPATKMPNGYWKIRVKDFEDFLKARQEVGKRRVLIVDDQSSDLEKLSFEISALGHHAVLAHSSVDALLKAADLYPALFVLNLSMKGANIWKLADKLRNTRSIKNVPMLFLAEKELSDTDSEQALELGVQGFMRKPIKAPALVKEVDRILGRVF